MRLLGSDGADYSLKVEQEREAWEHEQRGQAAAQPTPRGISRRSVSKERWVETLVVADSKLMDYHGSKNVESYIFTIMNMVSWAGCVDIHLVWRYKLCRLMISCKL